MQMISRAPDNIRRYSESFFGMTTLLAAYVSLNFSLLSGGEYQPVLYLLICLSAIFINGRIDRATISLGALIIFICFISSAGNDSFSLSAWMKILTVLVFLSCGKAILSVFTEAVLRRIIFLHGVVFFIWLLSPTLIRDLLSMINDRGVTYNYGYNSYFSSEPSYASLNLFGLYVLTRINEAGVKNIKRSSDFFVVAILVSTLSLTGIMLSLIVIYDYLSRILRKQRIGYFSNFVILFIAVFVVTLILPLVKIARFSEFLYFVTQLDFRDFVYTWALLEPSSSTRFIANMSAYFEGVYFFYGTGGFELMGPSYLVYPGWLTSVFFLNGLLGSGSGAQTPFFSIILFSGYLGLVWFAVLVLIAYSRSKKWLGGNKSFVWVFVVLCVFWQAALTYPFYWILLSVLYDKRNFFVKNEAKNAD